MIERQRGFSVLGVILGVTVIILLIIIVPWLSGFRTIDSGEIGVVRSLGKVTGRTLQPGASFISPFVDDVLTYNTKLVTYETATEEKQAESKADYKDFPVDTNTKDGQPVDISYTIRFSIDPTKATAVASSIGSEKALVEKIVKTESRIWVRNIPREFSAEELYSGDSLIKVQDRIVAKLKPSFAKNGIILDTVGIREVKFDNDYVAAVKQKQVEQVKIATEQNKAEQEKFKKEQRITAAEGKAQEQELQRTTISPELLQKMLIERWDGKYPQYLIMGGTGQFILPMPNR